MVLSSLFSIISYHCFNMTKYPIHQTYLALSTMSPSRTNSERIQIKESLGLKSTLALIADQYITFWYSANRGNCGNTSKFPYFHGT